VDQRIALVGVRPVDEGLAGLVVVVGDDLDCCGQGDEPADLSDLGDELGDGVLGRDGVVEEGRVKRPLVLSLEDAGLGDDVANRLEDPVRMLGLPQPRAPVGEDRVVKALVVKCQAACHLPADPVDERPGGLTIGEPLE